MKFWALLAVAVLVAGCVGQTAETGGQPPAQAPTETATPSAGLSVSVESAPATVVAGSRFSVTWKVNSPDAKYITKTAVYYGTMSHAGDAPTAMPPSTFNYHSVTPSQKGNAPSTFTDYVSAGDNPGKLYYRGYALIDQMNYWSDEYMVAITAKPSITVATYPTSVSKSSTFTVGWQVKDGFPGKVDKTYMMWGIRSGVYTSSSAEQIGITPKAFEATLTAPSTAPETVYFIVTAVVDGKAMNSTEMTLAVS